MIRMNVLAMLFMVVSIAFSSNISHNNLPEEKELEGAIQSFFLNYTPNDGELPGVARMTSYDVEYADRSITVKTNAAFAAQNFTKSSVRKIYRKLSKSLPKAYSKYKITVISNGLPIEALVPGMRYDSSDMPNMWGEIEYDGAQWVRNTSRPNTITHGLENRHLAIWASHGMYYDQNKGCWKWQRPNLFGTTEDLFTPTIVSPFLIPMLENAGATVFTPRERDCQTHEIIVDNDSHSESSYKEFYDKGHWETAPFKGFAYHNGPYGNNENPFAAGTARMVKTTKNTNKVSAAAYQPTFPEEGKYAVYVSYLTLPKSITDAEYIVYHKGQHTTLRVNQQMGGSTWVYLGTFEFDKGNNIYNRVVVTNNSSDKGLVTTDAVRFGGGMGNIQRGSSVSGMPRCLEGARYSAQWAGAPYSVYSGKGGTDDYSEDINVRSLMTNWLGGGSVYMPSLDGKNVPIELSLAVHSDAGYSPTDDIIGSLSICTTDFNDGRLNSGISRLMSRDLADSLLTGINRDIRAKYRRWNRRSIYDRNYSETRLPEVPSSIIETLSHQNFADMRMGHDPNFKFLLARSVYKTILRFVNNQHGRPYVVQPLAPGNFRAEIADKKIRLSWTPTIDETEPTATPTAYKVYASSGNGGFDNGVVVESTSVLFDAEPGMLYNFKVTAVNRGGESFPTQVLSACYHPDASGTVLIVDGFDRLASPAVINDDTRQGFDIDSDPGVSFGLNTGCSGQQQVFDKSGMGGEGPGSLGFGGNELAGTFFMGNEFCQAREHAEAIHAAGKYNIASCARSAIETELVKLSSYKCVDLILGLQKDDGYSLLKYKSFSPQLRTKLAEYMKANGRMMVSGSYIGSDMQHSDEQSFLADVLKLSFDAVSTDSTETITGLGMDFDIHRFLNRKHYAAHSVDVLNPISPAYCAMQYSDGTSAAVAYDGNDSKCIAMGFPLECIKDRRHRQMIMSGIMDFLMK